MARTAGMIAAAGFSLLPLFARAQAPAAFPSAPESSGTAPATAAPTVQATAPPTPPSAPPAAPLPPQTAWAPVYPPNYVYYPPESPAEFPPEDPPKPERETFRAARTTPFADAMLGTISLGERFRAGVLGFEFGTSLFGRGRFSGRALHLDNPKPAECTVMPFTTCAAVGTAQDKTSEPSWLFGGVANIAMTSGERFVFAPGLAYYRTNKDDYGSFIALEFQCDWVFVSGVRLGFNVDLGSATGGTAHYSCVTAANTCTPGTDTAQKRTSGMGFLAAFHLGWGVPPRR